jgi:hypothetical protein
LVDSCDFSANSHANNQPSHLYAKSLLSPSQVDTFQLTLHRNSYPFCHYYYLVQLEWGYPRRMTKQSSLPFVRVMAANPCFVTPKNEWPQAAARIASSAISNDPSVPFLNPMGKDNPDANSRWSWDSVVRAPIAPRDNKSAKNCRQSPHPMSTYLRRNRIQHFTGNRNPHIRQITKQFSRNSQPLVYLETSVNIRIVYKSLPSHCRSLPQVNNATFWGEGYRFLKVRSHDNEEILI